jgi:DNA-binding transcriptional MerR regulator
MNAETRYSLADLARVTGVTSRTVRYYIAQGLLPGANETGPGAWYDERHLARLQLIRELQRQHLPLAEIRSRLAGLRDADVSELLTGQMAKAEEPAESALDYIRGLLGTPREEAPPLLMRMASSPPSPAAPLMKTQASETDVVSSGAGSPEVTGPAHSVVRGAITTLGASNAPAAAPAPAGPPATMPPATTEAAAPPTPSRSQWDRIALTDDIELHVRRPLSRLDSKRVERLITIARQVLGEEKP